MNSTNFDKVLRQVVIVPVCALLLVAGILIWQILSFNRTVALIESSDRVVASAMQIEAAVVDQETGLRGYQLTHEPVFLEPYHAADKVLRREFEHLRNIERTAAERRQVDVLQASYLSWEQQFAEPLIKEIGAGRSQLRPGANLAGKHQMDDIRGQISVLAAAAQKRRDDNVDLWRLQVRTLVIAFTIIALIVGLMIGLYVRSLLHVVSSAYRQSHHALRVRAEQTFRSEEKLRTTLESIGDGVITCDAAGRIQTMNSVARELTRWSSEDAFQKPLEQVFSIIDQSSRQAAESPVEKVKRLNRVVGLSNHTVLVRRDGSELFIDDSGAPIRDKYGNLVGIVLVFRDITLAKRSRDALLANEKLAVAGRLAASIAHEIHNPLDSVSNLLYLMADNATPEEKITFLELAQQEITRVTQISRAMLSLYREARTPVPVDVKEMLQSILLLMDRRLRTSAVSVQAEYSEGLTVHGFPAELRQVFSNLLTNAAEASGPGRVIHVSAGSVDATLLPDGRTRAAGAVVAIRDDGPGIPPEVLGELFRPFFTTKGEGGTGLGLWISRGIITKHGGTIDLASDITPDHHGTTVTVYLACEPDFSLVE